MNGRIALLALIASVSTSTLFAQDEEDLCIAHQTAIEAKIACLKDVTFSEQNFEGPSPYRTFHVRFQQPLDHNNPNSTYFSQDVVLLHRSENEPMVFQTSGYSIFGVRETAIAKLFETNQIQVEHRFFNKSIPTVVDWSKLDIKQSADDFHRIVVAFKKIYKKNWVNTGASKGGMTSVFHRRFYPDDMNGTVADVAPLSFGTSDERYVDFMKNVGGDEYKDCRENWKKLQVSLLENRDEIVAKIEGNFTHLGSKDMAFEHAVIEAPYYFWQYGNPKAESVGCANIPSTGTVEEQSTFLFAINPMSNYSDEDLKGFIPYYFQAATQLGNPGNLTDHIDMLRKFEFTIDQYTPQGLDYTYSDAAMRDIKQWVENESQGIMFIYGEYDPWSAGAFPIRDAEHETMTFWVAGGNHSSKFNLLKGEDYKASVTQIAKWLGKDVDLNALAAKKKNLGRTLEDIEFQVRQRLRL